MDEKPITEIGVKKERKYKMNKNINFLRAVKKYHVHPSIVLPLLFNVMKVSQVQGRVLQSLIENNTQTFETIRKESGYSSNSLKVAVNSAIKAGYIKLIDVPNSMYNRYESTPEGKTIAKIIEHGGDGLITTSRPFAEIKRTLEYSRECLPHEFLRAAIDLLELDDTQHVMLFELSQVNHPLNLREFSVFNEKDSKILYNRMRRLVQLNFAEQGAIMRVNHYELLESGRDIAYILSALKNKK